ncbi:MAG: hypothetical protein HUJ74_03555, partial [Lachnospiraceae bacterium]|nr:hypothetical protein [Lachnospiraceae bacterium]
DIMDLKARLRRLVIGYTDEKFSEQRVITARDLHIASTSHWQQNAEKYELVHR